MPSDSALTSPHDLLAALREGRAPTLVDIRPADEVSAWSIDGDGVVRKDVPASELETDPAAAAARIPEGSVLVCNRGKTALRCQESLARAGRPVAVLEDGLRGWLRVLQDVEVPVARDDVAVTQVQRPGRGCLSYVVSAGGEALVVDPAPVPEHYVDLAERKGLRIVGVVDTHLHADHLSGARQLAERAGAPYFVPRGTIERGVAWESEATVLDPGAKLQVGGVEVDLIALPGHTTDMSGVLVPGAAVITGDSLLPTGIARPDLERGDPEGARAMAKVLHRTLRETLLPLGDDIVVLGAHEHPGLRSGPVAPTLGEVRAAVPELSIESAEEFADELLRQMPPRPANYEMVIEANAGRVAPDPELEAGGNSCSSR